MPMGISKQNGAKARQNRVTVHWDLVKDSWGEAEWWVSGRAAGKVV